MASAPRGFVCKSVQFLLSTFHLFKATNKSVQCNHVLNQERHMVFTCNYCRDITYYAFNGIKGYSFDKRP